VPPHGLGEFAREPLHVLAALALGPLLLGAGEGRPVLRVALRLVPAARLGLLAGDALPLGPRLGRLDGRPPPAREHAPREGAHQPSSTSTGSRATGDSRTVVTAIASATTASIFADPFAFAS
jgi:hypothetical protein